MFGRGYRRVIKSLPLIFILFSGIFAFLRVENSIFEIRNYFNFSKMRCYGHLAVARASCPRIIMVYTATQQPGHQVTVFFSVRQGL
jgi:hypothetical protein